MSVINISDHFSKGGKPEDVPMEAILRMFDYADDAVSCKGRERDDVLLRLSEDILGHDKEVHRDHLLGAVISDLYVKWNNDTDVELAQNAKEVLQTLTRVLPDYALNITAQMINHVPFKEAGMRFYRQMAENVTRCLEHQKHSGKDLDLDVLIEKVTADKSGNLQDVLSQIRNGHGAIDADIRDFVGSTLEDYFGQPKLNAQIIPIDFSPKHD